MGRKKTSGNRSSGGRKKKASTAALRMTKPDRGNARAIERFERFSHAAILGGKAGHDAYDGPGQLHAMGYFHNQGFEPDVIRDILREYASLYWMYYPLGARTGNFEQRIRSEPSTRKTRDEARFMALDKCLKLGSAERGAVHIVAVDYFHSDTPHPAIERLVNEGMRRLGLPVAGYLADTRDTDLLAATLRGAFQLIDESLLPRFVPAMPPSEMFRAAKAA